MFSRFEKKCRKNVCTTKNIENSWFNEIFFTKEKRSILFSQREFEQAKFERTKAEQERTRKEEELQKLKELALKEQQNLNEKRLNTLVDDFIRMKALTVRRIREENKLIVT